MNKHADTWAVEYQKKIKSLIRRCEKIDKKLERLERLERWQAEKNQRFNSLTIAGV